MRVQPGPATRRTGRSQRVLAGLGGEGRSFTFAARRARARRWPGLRRRPPRWYGWLRRAVALVVVAGLLFALVDWRLRPTLHQIASAQARVLATEAVTQAVATEIAEDIRWEDLYALRPDSTGRVVLVQPNTAEIDRLTSKVTTRVQELLKKVTETQVQIPLGQVFGSQILANMGPRIPISVVPVGTVTTKILSDFEQAGINQIRHKIYLEVAAHIKLVVPLVASAVDVTVQVPITEVLIMGDVPQTYIQLEGSELRNLLLPQTPPAQ
ncbi:MAG: sporulation protein YunB [Betaproteobacteria bacterium]